jgi:hypothetical protein
MQPARQCRMGGRRTITGRVHTPLTLARALNTTPHQAVPAHSSCPAAPRSMAGGGGSQAIPYLFRLPSTSGQCSGSSGQHGLAHAHAAGAAPAPACAPLHHTSLARWFIETLPRVTLGTPQAAEILQRANERYTAKDLMAAMKLYEDALNEVGWGGVWWGGVIIT